jgi:dolichyl-phosphate-mannose--protein O-mannosyl transferase
LGGIALGLRVAGLFIFGLAGGVAILVFWPG